MNRTCARCVSLIVTAAAALWSAHGEGARAASPCDAATHPGQCGWIAGSALPPFLHDAIVAKGGSIGAGEVLVLTSGDPFDPDTEISNDVGQLGCGANPDGWDTYDCVLLDAFVPPQDSVVLALSSEWFEWYQTIFTDWMTIAGAGVPTVDVSINSWIHNKVDVIPYGPQDTGVVILTSLAASKMVNFRVADSGDHIYDTALVVVPASWFANLGASNADATILCGNGRLEPGEACDDGNTITDDGCSSLCLGTQPASPPPTPTACGNLVYAWPSGTTSPYTCGSDLCGGYRCVVGNTISPACYTASQCASACAGVCIDVQTSALDCNTMCTVQPPATSPPPPLPATCASLVYSWPDGSSMPYSCDDPCVGQRCVIGATISPTCFELGSCEALCPAGSCVDTPAADCAALCALAELTATCSAAEIGQTRLAANQKGPCLGNLEICNSLTVWELADGAWQPQDETCNGLDDDCNGVADDLFVTCGDPGLCQNTVNTCDPNDPTVPVPCVPLLPPSPVEICNDGLDNDCDGSADDGCECGDDTCMPGETYENCPLDCPAPANGTPCDDGDLCTVGDTYQSGVCLPGAPLACDDGNLCVVAGACSPTTGCSATKVNCDDLDPCTLDACDPGSGCVYTVAPACQDADGDGYIDAAVGGDDCNDQNAAIHPGAFEACNGLDDDCNGGIDDGYNVGDFCLSAPNACGEAAVGSKQCTGDGLGSACSAAPPTPLDSDGDGTPDCLDLCPNDPAKIVAGVCGCGVADSDTNGNGIIDCLETVRADLAASIRLATSRPHGGKRLSLALSVANLGPARATSVTIHAALTGGPFSGLRLPRGCSGTATAIVCNVGRLAAGHSASATISVVPAAGAQLHVGASVASPVYDPNPSNQSATLDVSVP